MSTKKTYVSPQTDIIGCNMQDALMEGTMTLYTGSPFTNTTTVSFGPGLPGYGSSDGHW